MNSIRQVPTRVKTRRVETNLGAEREHFDKQQAAWWLLGKPHGYRHGCLLLWLVIASPLLFGHYQLSSISKAINSTETPVKEKHARRIILGTHREKGAYTFWSYALGLPLAGSSILSWKFCHVLHKVLRDGHTNGNLHDKYGQLVALYSKLLCTKLEFHVKVLHI
ncbi:hypothetical protein NHX12_028741, partial [Muraenolepis orangiensis]